MRESIDWQHIINFDCHPVSVSTYDRTTERNPHRVIFGADEQRELTSGTHR